MFAAIMQIHPMLFIPAVLGVALGISFAILSLVYLLYRPFIPSDRHAHLKKLMQYTMLIFIVIFTAVALVLMAVVK